MGPWDPGLVLALSWARLDPGVAAAGLVGAALGAVLRGPLLSLCSS